MDFSVGWSLTDFITCIFWTGVFLNSVDRSNEDGENQVSTNAKANMEPLLEENRHDMPENFSEA